MREGGRAGGRADEPALSLSLTSACNPYCKRIPRAQDNTSHVFCPLVFHLAPTHLGWARSDNFTRRSRDPGVETPTASFVVRVVPRCPGCASNFFRSKRNFFSEKRPKYKKNSAHPSSCVVDADSGSICLLS
jgi:hypothetical protein